MTTYNANVNNGVATIQIPTGDITVGTHNINARYTQNNQYNESNTTAELTIQKADLNYTIEKVNCNVDDQLHLKVHITRATDNQPITGTRVVIRVNSKTFKDLNGDVLYVPVVDGVMEIKDGQITQTDGTIKYYNQPILEEWKTNPPNIRLTIAGTTKYNTLNTPQISLSEFINIQ